MASAGYSIEGMKCTFSPLLDLLCCKVFRGAETVHISGALHFLVNQKEHIQFSLDEIFYPSGEASAKDARNSGSVSRSEGSMDKTHQTASRKEHSNARSILDTAPSFVSQAASSTVDVSEVDSDVVIKTEQGTIVDSFSFLEAADDMDTEAICSWQTVQEASTSGHRVSDVEGDQMESDKQGAESPDEENPAEEKPLKRTLMGIMATLQTQSTQIKYLQERIQAGAGTSRTQANIDCEFDLPEEVKVLLPLKTMEDVDTLDNILQDETVAKKLVLHLASIGGINLVDTVKRIMLRIVTNKLAQYFNWFGRREKRAFSQLKLFAILLRAVRKNARCAAVTEEEVARVAKKWLHGAKDRDGGRKEREVRRQQVNNTLYYGITTETSPDMTS